MNTLSHKERMAILDGRMKQIEGISKEDMAWIDGIVESRIMIRSEIARARLKLLMMSTIAYMLDKYNVTPKS